MKLYDVAVIGAGPIGSYTAYRLADKGFDVCLLDEKERIGEDIVCAGVISKEAFKRYDLPHESILSRIDSFTFVSPRCQRLEYTHHDVFAYVTDRKVFDKCLFKLAQKVGVETHLKQSVLEIKKSSNFFTLHCINKQYRTKAVVLATGINYQLQDQLGMGRPPNFLYGSQIELPITTSPSNIEIHIGQSFAPGSFGWIVPKNHSSLVGTIVEKNGKVWLERMLKERLNFKVSEIKRDGIKVKPIAFGSIKKSIQDKVLAVGEAAGQVKTTTGGSIFYGLLCSEIAVDKLTKTLRYGDNLNDYEITWRSVLTPELEIGKRLRRVASSLSDDTIERLFSFVKLNRFWVQLLVPRINFDYHSNMIFFCLESFRSFIRKPCKK